MQAIRAHEAAFHTCLMHGTFSGWLARPKPPSHQQRGSVPALNQARDVRVAVERPDRGCLADSRACLLQLSVHLNGKPVEELTQLVPKAAFLARARKLADALAQEIPRQQFLIRVQVLAGNRSVAKADIKPYRKDVTAKLVRASLVSVGLVPRLFSWLRQGCLRPPETPQVERNRHT